MARQTKKSRAVDHAHKARSGSLAHDSSPTGSPLSDSLSTPITPPSAAAPSPAPPPLDLSMSANPHVPPPPADPATQPPLLFEVAWEVCWKLGGIYTVLRTKAPSMIERWSDRYIMIGPYNPATAAWEFEEQSAVGLIRQTIDKLREESGITAHYGRWLVPGRPAVILLDYRPRYPSLDADKFLMWKDHGISTVQGDGEVNEVVAFGFCVAEFFAKLSQVVGNRRVLAHFHEWMAGVAVPRIAHLKIPVHTVFTTHATLLGRYLASDSPEFYNHLPFLDPDCEAAKYNIHPRFAIERAAAHAATVFTTVSEVTDTEATKLLGRKADVILPNGLNIQKFSALHEFQNLHQDYKQRIHEFVMGHFFPAYTFDLDRTLYLFTSGRYEYRNKGMDLFIEALHRLNWRLRELPDRPTVVAFIVTKTATKNLNVGVLQNHSMFEDLRRVCTELEHRMGDRLFATAVRGKLPRLEDLLDEDQLIRLRQSVHVWRNGRQPAIVTHDLMHDGSDAILQHLRHRQMFNSADDPVKVVFHPEFVTATSPLIGLDYEQFVRGCHLGVFPSYYEPWGYTPMESLAMGVPAVTTDLSGFGSYVQHHIPDHKDRGITVLNRRTQGFDRTIDELVEYLFNFVQMNRRQRIELRNKVERLSELFDWSALVSHYHEAHDLALQRAAAGKIDVRFA